MSGECFKPPPHNLPADLKNLTAFLYCSLIRIIDVSLVTNLAENVDDACFGPRIRILGEAKCRISDCTV
ncbi:hypothetical protein ACFL2Q_18910 [Thermodesulfobacteriota bacterium]